MWEWALGPLFFMTILEHSPPSGGGERSDPLKDHREGGTWPIYISKPGGGGHPGRKSRAVPLLDVEDPIRELHLCSLWDLE